MDKEGIWHKLPYEEWKNTLEGLHMKMQILGKVKLELCPFLNQWWQVAFRLTSTGFSSGLIPYNTFVFEFLIDLDNHSITIQTSDCRKKIVPLTESSVSDFYTQIMKALSELDIQVNINTLPTEVSNPIRCEEDNVQREYDKYFVNKWWKILLQIHKVFDNFRSDFRGKSSPVHFFWGSFDLCETRFSGNKCDPPENGGIIMRYAENEENFTFGFWAGNTSYPKPAFYSYFYPALNDISDLKYFNTQMGEFILDYNEVLNSTSPETLILNFLNASYQSGAKLAKWNVNELHSKIPEK